MMEIIRNLLLIFFSSLVSFSFAQSNFTDTLDYPQVKTEVYSQSMHGVNVIDEFHYLEKTEDEDIKEWYKAQDSLAEAYFDNNLMTEYLERFKDLQAISEGGVEMIRINEQGNYFYLRSEGNTEKLFYRKNLRSEEMELFTSSKFGKITYLCPSFDGLKIAIGFETKDGFSSRIVIYDLQKKSLLPEEITNINPSFGGIEWLPNSQGFIYLYFPNIDNSESNFKKESFSVLHLLGDDPQDLRFIFGNKGNVNIPSDYYPKVKIGSSKDKHIIGYSASSSDYYDAYVAKVSDILSGNLNWKPFFKEKHKVFYNQGELRKDEFIFRQGSSSGNRLSKVNVENADFTSPVILAEGSKENPISDFAVTKDNIYFIRTLFGVEVSLYKVNEANKNSPVELPFNPGYLSFFGNSVLHNDIGFGIDGWISDYVRYTMRGEEISKENLVPQVEFPQFLDLISTQIMVASHDGEEVPLSLVYRKDLQLNSENEVFIYVYGAYGESMTPFFSPLFLDWASQGGVLAFPHVRGGGEKGKDWHFQGMKNNKYNSWKDLIACAEALIKKGVTRKGLVSVYTSSAGGITAGMAVNERPDLFSSFIAEVPRLNPLGLESSSNASSTSFLEYGTVKDSLEFRGLLKMDPYMNISETSNYPATLILPSYKDDRIPLWDSGKYIAKLQRIELNDSPILMDIDYDSGHENQGELFDVARLYSKIFSFAKGNMQR